MDSQVVFLSLAIMKTVVNKNKIFLLTITVTITKTAANNTN